MPFLTYYLAKGQRRMTVKLILRSCLMLIHVHNKTVSVGDTDISLHIPPGGQVKSEKSSKICQDLPKFEFSGGGGGILGKSKVKSLELPRSA